MEQSTEQFMEALEASKKIEEAGGVAQAFKTVGRTIANAFGTAQGNAQRNAKAAQSALTTAQTNAQTAQTNKQTAQTNVMDDITLAKTVNDAMAKALNVCDKGLDALAKQQSAKKPEQKTEQAPENEEQVEQTNAGQEEMSESLNFVFALQEAAGNTTKKFYNDAKNKLKAVQQLIRPFLTGQKKFTAKDIDDISQVVNDQTIQQVLGKNDKKSLKVIQNLNAALNTKKDALEHKAEPNNAQNVESAADSNTQSAQTTPAENTQSSNSAEQQENTTQQANTQATNEAPVSGNTLKAVNQVENAADTGNFQTLSDSIKALEKFKGNKKIDAVLNAWQAYSQEKQKLDTAIDTAKS